MTKECVATTDGMENIFGQFHFIIAHSRFEGMTHYLWFDGIVPVLKSSAQYETQMFMGLIVT